MDEFEQKLNGILNDPAQLQSIFALAQSLGLGTPPGETQKEPDPLSEKAPPAVSTGAADSKPPGIDAGALLEAGRLDRRQENLLCALKPFLKPEKQEKIDRAMQIARLTHLAEFALRDIQTHHEI